MRGRCWGCAICVAACSFALLYLSPWDLTDPELKVEHLLADAEQERTSAPEQEPTFSTSTTARPSTTLPRPVQPLPPIHALTFFTPHAVEWPSCEGCGKLPKPRNKTIPYCDVQKRGYKNHYNFFVHGMLANSQLHKRLGYKLFFVDDPFRADLVVCCVDGVELFINDTRRWRRQFILSVETGDQAYVQTHMRILSKPEVFAAVKHHSWRLSAQRCGKERPLKEEILKVLTRQKSPVPQSACGSICPSELSALLAARGCRAIKDQLLQKVHTAIPSWLTVQRGAWWTAFRMRAPPIARRPIDVAFVGNASGEFRREHRESLIKALTALQVKHRKWNFHISGEKMPQDRFARLLSVSKLFVSPWGYGEWSGKDEEAVLAGAVLVKPLSACTRHVMPMYDSSVDVRPDWRDLEEALKLALGNKKALQKLQETGLQSLRPYLDYQAAWKNSRVLKAFTQMLANATSLARVEFAKPL